MALYLEHFGLREAPFRITPHTDFFFDGAERGATLEALLYAVVHDEGIVKVSGEVGSGKTMLCRVLMERLPPEVESIYLATPSLAQDEILRAIAEDLDLELPEGRTATALRALQERLIGLYAAGRRVVVLVDEAHAMPEETLEQVRLLSNLESNRHKLLQMVLFGQPEFDQTLAKDSLRPLRDRITHSFRMRPLKQPEVAKYLSFRMRAAGYRGPEVFSRGAVRRIAAASHGLTRRINILADKALLAAFSQDAHAITPRHVRAAVRDSEFAALARPAIPVAVLGAALAVGVLAGTAIERLLPRAAPLEVQPRVIPMRPAAKPAESPAPKPPPDPARLDPAQLTRFARYSASGQPLLDERLQATRRELATVPGGRFAIELFVTGNPDAARMERFLLRARELVPLERLWVIPLVGGAGTRLWVLYGDYADRQAALAAEQRLPEKYRKAFRTVPRSFEELRHQV